MSVVAPDTHGRRANVVIGFDTVEEYRDNPQYLGAIVGRFANRIANACFTLDGKTYQLAANIGPNHLHAGRKGLDQRLSPATHTAATLDERYTNVDSDTGDA